LGQQPDWPVTGLMGMPALQNSLGPFLNTAPKHPDWKVVSNREDGSIQALQLHDEREYNRIPPDCEEKILTQRCLDP
jgi:hypothetical protein